MGIAQLKYPFQLIIMLCTSYISATSAPLCAHAICVTNWYFVDGVTAISKSDTTFQAPLLRYSHKKVLFILSQC